MVVSFFIYYSFVLVTLPTPFLFLFFFSSSSSFLMPKIFTHEKQPSISIRLRDMDKKMSVLTSMDYWLDNIMAGVPVVRTILSSSLLLFSILSSHLASLTVNYRPPSAITKTDTYKGTSC